MRIIQELLSRYTKLAPPDAIVRRRLSKIITEETQKEVSERDIRIIGPIAYCTLPSIVKNALFMKKETVLKRLNEEFGKEMVRDLQ